MKRAIMVMATVVAFFCSPAYATAPDLAELMNSLPKNPNTIPSWKRIAPYARTAGGALIRLNPAGAAASAGLAVSGYLFGRSEQDQVFEMLQRLEDAQDVTGWDDPNTPPDGSDGTFEAGTFWSSNGAGAYASFSATDTCTLVAESSGRDFNRLTGSGPDEYGCKAIDIYGIERAQGTVERASCDGFSWLSQCNSANYPTYEPTETEWPEDDFVAFYWNGSSWEPHTYENPEDVPDAYTMPREFYYTTPEGGTGLFQGHYDGSQTITEWLEKNVEGVVSTDTVTTKVDKDGNVQSVQVANLPGTIEDVIANAPEADTGTNSISIDLPDDYAREDTLTSIKDLLNPDPVEPPPTNEATDPYQDINDDISGQGEELGSIPLLDEIPTLSGGGNCPTFSIYTPLDGGTTLTADQHCGFYTSTLLPAIEWLLGLGTLLYLIFLYRIETTRNV